MTTTAIPLATSPVLKTLAKGLRADLRAAVGVPVRVRVGTGSQRGHLHIAIDMDHGPEVRALVAAELAADGWVEGRKAPNPRSFYWTVRVDLMA